MRTEANLTKLQQNVLERCADGTVFYVEHRDGRGYYDESEMAYLGNGAVRVLRQLGLVALGAHEPCPGRHVNRPVRATPRGMSLLGRLVDVPQWGRR